MTAAGSIRLATRADAAEIAAMSRDEIERGLPWSWTEERVARAIADPEINVAVAGDSGALVAFGIMSYRETTAHLQLFGVRQSHRRQAEGTRLLAWLEAVARAAGIASIQLECRRSNASAREFYAEHGYHEHVIAKGYYRGVEDAVRLEKRLSAPT